MKTNNLFSDDKFAMGSRAALFMALFGLGAGLQAAPPSAKVTQE